MGVAEPTEASFAGSWDFLQELFGRVVTVRIKLEVQDSRVICRRGPGGKVSMTGTVLGNTIELFHEEDQQIQGRFTGVLVGDEMNGEGVYRNQTIRWRALRSSEQRPESVHAFLPSTYAYVISATASPILHLSPGDTVITELLDSKGVSKTGEKKASDRTPLVGPFYVESAMPGDALAVHIKHLRPNRDWSKGGDAIFRQAIPQSYHKYLLNQSPTDTLWRLDLDSWTGSPIDPPPRLQGYKIQLRPSLGCVATAPISGESLVPQRGGNHGGDLDCPLVGAGATVYLPVGVRGGYLYIGDGHAVQADGEVVGDALETSMDIEFTVDVRRNYSVRQPRVETADNLAVIGLAGDAGDALRVATGELGRWLLVDHNLSSREIALILATSIRYSVGKFSPNASVAAIVSKHAIPPVENT